MRSLLVIGLGAVLAACGSQPEASAGSVVPVPTQEPRFGIGLQACPAALLEGTLVEHPVAGLAVQGDPLFEPSVVVWPHGWVAVDVDGTTLLLENDGRRDQVHSATLSTAASTRRSAPSRTGRGAS